jgi:probable phosphoglycerate mutase
MGAPTLYGGGANAIRLILWRHGRTAWNVTGRVQGQTDVDLDEVGVAQAVDAAPRVAAYRPDVIISSDLRRAARTADALAAVTGLAVEHDERLRERYYGPWQGLEHAEIRERYPEAYARWGIVEPIGVPEIETVDDLGKRMLAVMRDTVQRIGTGRTAVLVTHGGAARAGCAALLGWSEEMLKTVGALGNCHVAELRNADERGWQLRAHNLA